MEKSGHEAPREEPNEFLSMLHSKSVPQTWEYCYPNKLPFCSSQMDSYFIQPKEFIFKSVMYFISVQLKAHESEIHNKKLYK